MRKDPSNGHFTIFDLAKELDVKKSHIRLCEENGLISPRTSRFKRRVYNRYDRERLRFVFHFVLLGYSKEEIIELIGIPDAELDENDQLIQGIEYGSKALNTLEKRKEDLSFTKQTRIITEIERLREYIQNIKMIKSGVIEEPWPKPSIEPEERAKILSEPVMAITSRAEKKTTQHPVKVISLFVAGLALVILVGSYFYYKVGQTEKNLLKTVQKKPVHSEKILEPKTAESLDQTAKARVTAPEVKTPEPDSPALRESLDASSTDGSLIGKETSPSQTAKEKPVTAGEELLPEKQNFITQNVEEGVTSDVQKKFAGEELSEKAASASEGANTLATEVPEPVKEKAVPDTVSEEPLTAALPESGVEEMAKTEVKPFLTGSEKKVEQIPSEEKRAQQKKELSRLKSFLNEYCQAYSNKDLDKLLTFFTSDATENNRPFHELLPDYRNNMESMGSLTYRIELLSYSKQISSENLIVRGKFFIRHQLPKGDWEEKNGTIFMELLEKKDSFLIKQLNYSE